MGKYRGAVVTTIGQNIIAQAIASAGTVTWMTAEASSHAYPAGTNFEALTSLQNVEQTVNISSVQVFGGNIVQVLCRFENAGVATSFPIETIGLWARLGSDPPVLTAVVAADTADVMPVDNPESPSAFIYDIQMTIQNADSFTVTVNPAGTATAADLHEAQVRLADVEDAVAQKADYADLATVEATATASRAYAVGEYLVYNGTLYRVTAAIASGGTITPGTNASAVTAGSELKSLEDTKAKYSNLAYVESTWTASRNYTKGDFLVCNGTFYMATVDIATGDTLAVGTNIRGGTVGGWLSSYASQIPNKTDLRNLAVIEATSTASRSYQKDAYLVYDGTLYKAASVIASGETLVPGTNITEVKVGGQLKAINDQLAKLPTGLSFNTGASVTMRINSSVFSPITKVAQIMAFIEVGSSGPSIPLTIATVSGTAWYGGGMIMRFSLNSSVLTLQDTYRFDVQTNGRLQSEKSLVPGIYVISGTAFSN